ncbi:MAG: CinA family protein [Flavobacteriales bacterium]|nr:CinA family protein [Flavobacteriales bacterium]
MGVAEEKLKNYGAVSEEVVKEMAEGARKKFKTDYAIATSGIAGPDGGTKEKPIGLVWMAIAGPEKTVARMENPSRNRERNITISSLTALNWLRNKIISGELE